MRTFRLEQPRNNKQFLAFLERNKLKTQSSEEQKLSRAAPVLDLAAPWFQQSDALLEPFRASFNTLKTAYRDRGLASQLCNDIAERLSFTIRDYVSGLQRRIRRNGEPEEVLTYYRVPTEGLTPQGGTPAEWREIGVNLVESEAAAVAAGYQPMANPSAADLQEILDTFDQHHDHVQNADIAYGEAQRVMNELREEAILVWRGIAQNLRLILADRDTATQRRVLRNFGFVFRSSAEEETEEPEVDPELEEGEPPTPETDPNPEAEPNPASALQPSASTS